jgi:hypothetical protein
VGRPSATGLPRRSSDDERNRQNGGPCACGLRYADLRCGYTFKTARREIIAIAHDTKRGKTKYGRRHGVLGFLHEIKQSMWKSHVAACDQAFDERKTA